MLLDFINHFLIPCFPLLGMLFFNSCCCESTPSCTFFTDDFNRSDDDDPGAYTEVSGDWDIVSNRLSTSSTNAILIADTEHPEGEPNIKVSITVNIANNNNIARFILDYVDSSNYWMFELQSGGSGFFRLVRRSGGSNTTIFSNALNNLSNTNHQVCVSIRDGIVSGSIGSSTITATGSFSSPKFGFGTGSSNTGAVRFDDLTASRTNEDCPSCAVCSACGGGLPDNFPLELQFEVSGVTAPLTHYNGLWTAAFKSCEGGGARWETRYTDLFLSPCGEGPGTNQQIIAIIDVIYNPSTDLLTLSATLTNDFGFGASWNTEISMDEAPDCFSFSEESLPHFASADCSMGATASSIALLSTP